jgi:hypothetical protein
MDIWFDTVAPDQYLRTQMEEATFICSEHAFRVQNFDHDNFANVFFVNDTKAVDETVDTTNPVKPVDDTPSDQALYDEWYEEISDNVDKATDTDARARTFRLRTQIMRSCARCSVG